jgi:steroid delta-isomerase-like uncharacterized protein
MKAFFGKEFKMSSEEINKAIIRRYWDEKWNLRRPAALDELMMANVTYHGTSMEMNGIEEYRQVYSGYLCAFHDSKAVVEDLVAEGDKVASRVMVSAVHKGELASIPVTGKTITIRLFTMFRLAEGKIAEEWEILDEMGIMQQLGVIPAHS